MGPQMFLVPWWWGYRRVEWKQNVRSLGLAWLASEVRQPQLEGAQKPKKSGHGCSLTAIDHTFYGVFSSGAGLPAVALGSRGEEPVASDASPFVG
jgi:hypothetical protein